MSSAELLMTDQQYVPEMTATHNSQQESLSWRSRLGGAIGKVAAVGTLLAGGIAGALGNAQPAEAADRPDCYGDWCSGQYARDTGCDRDARTIAEAEITQTDQQISVTISSQPGINIVPGDSLKVGTLSLRYSDECGTGWAVLNTNRSSGIDFVGVQHTGGYTQKRNIGRFWSGSPAARSHSPMVYTRSEDLRAFVDGTGMMQGFDSGTEFIDPKTS